MNQHAKNAAALLAVLVAAVVLAACGDSNSGSNDGSNSDSNSGNSSGSSSGSGSSAGSGNEANGSAQKATIVVKGGEPVGGVQELEYDAGEEIGFRVESDVADEIHVHGYDLMQDVEAGGSVAFAFPAEIEGIFEVELEGRGEQIAEIRVNP